ncbi:SagB/ThcOx family dehydrogenase [candidate division WOR-3 bacterium]|nr:SagB/ThcOx family dehydrogenase [candidate division WOR-3 bacterium]
MKALPLLGVLLFIACPKEGALGKSNDCTVTLPDPVRTDRSIEECMSLRRSVRSFSADTLSLAQLSNLLWAAQGVTEPVRGFRTTPSAGATYPLEVYVFDSNGVFHYEPGAHKITIAKSGDQRAELARACLNQGCVKAAPTSIVLCAVPERTSARYGERAMRYIYMEAGHTAQNIHLEAVALGLGSVPVGAFDDEAVAKLLDLDKAIQETVPLYVIPVGVPVP